MVILFCLLLSVCPVGHTSGVMQDRCAHLLSSLQQCPLFVESECDVLRVYVREVVVVDLPEQEECQLSVRDLPSQ